MTLLHFSLARKISLSIVAVTALALVLVFYSSSAYQQFARQQQSQTIQKLAHLEAEDLIQQLKKNSLDLALNIENEKAFTRSFKNKNTKVLTQQLDSQFHQYFVTAGVVKLLKLYILDTNFTLIGTSTEGVKTNIDASLICPQLSQQALKRKGFEKLQTMSRSCSYQQQPVFAVIVPFGGLNPKGYIQIITQPPYNLRKMEQALAMPIQMMLLDNQIIYQSKDWLKNQNNKNHLTVQLPILDNDNNVLFVIALQSDMNGYNENIKQFRNWLILILTATAALSIIVILLTSQRRRS